MKTSILALVLVVVGCGSTTEIVYVTPDAGADVGATGGAPATGTGGAAGAPGTGGHATGGTPGTSTGGVAGRDAGTDAPVFCPINLSAYSATSTDASTVYYQSSAGFGAACMGITPPNWPSADSVTFTINGTGLNNPGPVAGKCTLWAEVEVVLSYTAANGAMGSCDWRAETYFSINY